MDSGVPQCSSVGLDYKNGSYESPDRAIPLFPRIWPTLAFRCRVFPIILKAGSKARRGKYDTTEWCRSSLAVLRALEEVGVKIEIKGTERFRTLEGPCVFLANHMSTLETFVLPVIIAPFKPVTFVVKQSLVETPVFKYVMRSRDPITVGRTNPREDLKAVLAGGEERLKSGISIVIFPQTTRFLDFDPARFNTIGIKLAKKADVPVVPVALKTDAWGNGRYLKDFGKMDPSKKVRFAFGEPMRVRGRGAEEHAEVIRFIISRLKEWEEADSKAVSA